MIKDFPLVSIGLPCYNRPEGLEKALICFTEQSYINIEIIVSENNSPNEKVESIIKKYSEKDKRIIPFKQSENQGGFFNFKFVLEQARGKYFMWASDDDYWENTLVEKAVNLSKERYCGVSEMLGKSAKIIYDIEYR